MFAGALFEGRLRRRVACLRSPNSRDELSEQILGDGGHFECSPMYHSLILEDVLDLINLSRTYPDLLAEWGGVVRRMLGWLQEADASRRPNRIF